MLSDLSDRTHGQPLVRAGAGRLGDDILDLECVCSPTGCVPFTVFEHTHTHILIIFVVTKTPHGVRFTVLTISTCTVQCY